MLNNLSNPFSLLSNELYINKAFVHLFFITLILHLVLTIHMSMLNTIKGCDSNFEVKCSNLKSRYK